MTDFLSVHDIRRKYYCTLRVGIFVAHPDDETIWAGGLLSVLHRPTVYACSIPFRDPIRVQKFFDACCSLNVDGRILPHSEAIQEPFPYLDAYTHLLHEFGLLVTHNASGEYGHHHHKQIHDWVVDNAKCPILCFGYGEHEGFELDSLSKWEKTAALNCYNHKSITDGGMTKADALRRVYGDQFDLFAESYRYASTVPLARP